MAILIETPKATDANSYATVLRSNEILGLRLYSANWDGAGTTPDAESYLANAVGSIGATSLAIDGGTGTFTLGSQFQFASHSTLYTVSAALTGAGTLTFTPALTAGVADNEAIARTTAFEKEQALIWASTLLDNMMVWYGFRRTNEQRMRWPRTGVVDQDGELYDEDTIPELLEISTAELALELLTQNKFALPGILGQGLATAKIGSISVKIDGSEVRAVIPPNILALLSPLGQLTSEANVGSSVVMLRRV